MKISKEYLLKQSNTFCILPWIHMYVNPQGDAAPCCISGYAATAGGIGSTKTTTIPEIINSAEMKTLRRNMLNGIKDTSCNSCYDIEARGMSSPRMSTNAELTSSFDEAMISPNGSIDNFKMKYFDIRFSNICNFKCRSCGSRCSSLWEQEDRQQNIKTHIIRQEDRPEFLSEVLEQIQYMDMAYFAGGEPLITDEHYVLLEEMIRQKRTDIKLKYNTNLSNLKFKDKDLLGLWKHFTNDIQVYASIDHYGDRAEYIRHGTNWAQVENNFLLVKEKPFIQLQMNTVLSVYNCTTMLEFYEYMYEKKLYNVHDQSNSLYHLTSPSYLNSTILPRPYQVIARENFSKLLDYIKFLDTTCEMQHPGRTGDKLKQLSNAVTWLNQDSTWHFHRDKFRLETNRLDRIRGESFVKTFPELAGLMED